MRALVTGGTGFIGSHLVDELLEQGYDVRVLRRTTSNITLLENKKLSFVFGDLTDRESLVRACQQVDVVFHVAALPRDWGPKKTFFEVNVDGTKNLLDACVQHKVPRFVFMSSAAVYGFPKIRHPIAEDYQKNPTLKYGESKLSAEGLLWGYGIKSNMTVSAVRSPVVIGPRDRLISLFLINALRQKRLFFIGDGNQKISLSDGRDVAHCLRLAGESRKANNQAYNVKSFDSTPRQLMETLAERLGLPVPEKHRSYLSAYVLASIIEGIWILRSKGNPPITRHKVRVMGTPRLMDITKATQVLKYTPRYTFATSIDDVVSWYRTFAK
ncbi:MAG: NAD(P)-dependent oxidoreductase [Euryarchaeota archaeon]|nr:NAD(P)-dependent oxidoreductase [Euryarchaeota archaeon]